MDVPHVVVGTGKLVVPSAASPCVHKSARAGFSPRTDRPTPLRAWMLRFPFGRLGTPLRCPAHQYTIAERIPGYLADICPDIVR